MKVDGTSQLSRIAQSPAATDLRGGNTSEDLSTVRRNNLAAEDPVFFQPDVSDKLERLDTPLPTLASLLSIRSPTFDSLSFAFFPSLERDCLKLMSLQDRRG